jgi:phosphatidylethanolamine-binding protein (PEBP) family uncharacterized protein
MTSTRRAAKYRHRCGASTSFIGCCWTYLCRAEKSPPAVKVRASHHEESEGLRHGINDFTTWFANDADMAGTYFGYDGPCPPWNDAWVHHYIFTLYALDIPRIDTDDDFTGPGIRAAIEGHVLEEAGLTGLYTLNPRLLR